MGWLIVAALGPLMKSLAPGGMFWLGLGGVLYTSGVIFFLLDEKVRHFHGVWHLFVMGGSIAQYFCILLYLI
jgi:hemolysin III